MLFVPCANWKTLFLMQIYRYTKVWSEAASKGVLKKKYSENMQEIYRRTPMPKCDFDKVTPMGDSTGVTAILLCSLKQVF